MEAGDKAFVVIRLGIGSIQEARNTFNKHFSIVNNYSGKFLGIGEQVEILECQKGLWPGNQAVALLQFPNMEETKRWFNSMPEVRQPDWLHAVDMVFVPARGSSCGNITPEKGCMALMDIQIFDKQRFFDDYAKPSGDLVRQAGGLAGMAATEQTYKQRGLWDPNYLVLHHFPSKQKAKEFFNGKDYQSLRQVRHATAATDMLLFDLRALKI